MNNKSILFFAILIAGVASYDNAYVKKTNAVGTWNGQDTIHIPMSWCAVNGSPCCK